MSFADWVLSFTLEVELDGRWPWQRRRAIAPVPGEQQGDESVASAPR